MCYLYQNHFITLVIVSFNFEVDLLGMTRLIDKLKNMEIYNHIDFVKKQWCSVAFKSNSF